MNKPRGNIHRALNNATTWNLLVWESDLGVHAKIVACYLRTHMNDYQEIAFPAVGRISRYCGICERTVQKALSQLCSSGFLLKGDIHPKYMTYIYTICTPAGDAPPHVMHDTPAGDAPKLTNELTNSVYIGKTRFSPPTIDEVRAYCLAKQYDIDADTFIAWNESKGWKVGNQPMKCWKSALTTWALRRKENGRDTTGTQGGVQQNRHKTTADKLRDKLAAATNGGRI